MKQPMAYLGIYPSNWAGYYFKERLGYTSGVHTGVDYNHGTDDLNDPAYAIASGKVVDQVASGKIGGFGNAIIIKTTGTPPGVAGTRLYHRYLHLNKISVKVGDVVKAGQKIGTVGKSGTTAAHLHLDVWTNRNGLGAHWAYHKDTQLASYEDPYKLITKHPNWDGAEGADVPTRQEVIDEYLVNRGAPPSKAEIDHHVKGTWKSMSLGFKAENDAKRKAHSAQVNALKKALENEKNKKPEVVVKEVEKIVTKIEKIEVPVEVTVEPSWLVKVREFINNFLGRK